MHVGAGIKLNNDLPVPLHRGGPHSPHTVKKANLGIQGLNNIGIDIFRTGAPPLDRDANHVEAEIGKELRINLAQREEA